MKLYKILLLLAALSLTPVVLMNDTSLHKPVVLEDENFKMTKSYQEPSDLQTMRLWKLSEAKSGKIEQKAVREYKPIKTSTLAPSEFYQYANGKNKKTEIADNSLPAPVFNTESDLNKPVLQEEEETAQELAEETLSQNNPLKSKILQKKEETIAWNKWRSDIQNEIMDAAAIEAPLGTLFFFSFDVSQYRHVSNIKIFCTNPMFQKEAVENIKPAIENLNNKKILAFPKNTRRKSVKFDGSYMIWVSTEYSSPDNYNDFERIQYYE